MPQKALPWEKTFCCGCAIEADASVEDINAKQKVNTGGNMYSFYISI